MSPFRQLIERIQSLDYDKLVLDAVQEKEKEVLALNTEQMYAGKDAENKAIRPPYSEAYARRKRARGQAADRVTLRDTGKFYGSLHLVYRNDEFEFVSDDAKAKYLHGRYGRDIYGLDENGIQQTIELIRDEVTQKLKKALIDD